MKTTIVQYLFCISLLLMLTCCKGRQNGGESNAPIPQDPPTEEVEWVHGNFTELSSVLESFENISKADLKWIKEIERAYPTNDTLRFWFKYDCEVDGYQVTGRFSPIDSESETGQMVMRFDNGNKVFYYQSIKDEELFTCAPIYLLCTKSPFFEWENKALYSLHYYKPEEDKDVDELHPLGFNTPFQFFDINFDGQKELMISDYGMFQGGNKYYTYSIAGSQLKKIESLPIKEVQTYSEIDTKNRTITLSVKEGADNLSIFTFKKGHAAKEPSFQYPVSLGADIYNEYKDSWKTNSFFLSSIQIYQSGEKIDVGAE